MCQPVGGEEYLRLWQRDRQALPPGYNLEITGTAASAGDGNSQLLSVLVIQVGNAIKPLLIFAVVPCGKCGAFAVLYVINSSFGFMAFPGIIALVGVIVFHIIMRESLLDAGIMRLRAVMITVGATIMALLPLAIHGGPLWQLLCYAQIGGVALATVVTLLLVPVVYSFLVLDLKWVKWITIEQQVAVV
jgi:multidrug efflux pump subunit AcrB